MRRALMLLLCLLSALGLGLGLGAGARAEPGPERELSVQNHAHRPVNELYVSPTTAENWGDDRLGDAQIAPGDTLRVKLGRTRDCVFDVQAIYDDASREERHGIDLCRNRVVVFDGTGAIKPADARGARHVVTVENDSARPIQQVFISSSDSGDWGDDLLHDGSLSVAARTQLAYHGDCVADLRIVYDNRGAEERRGLDLCAMGGIAIAAGWTTTETPVVPKGVGTEPVALPVVNQSGHPVRELFVTPEDGERGANMLGGPLADGASITVTVTRPKTTCRFAARIVFGEKWPDRDVTGLDLCHPAPLVLLPKP